MHLFYHFITVEDLNIKEEREIINNDYLKFWTDENPIFLEEVKFDLIPEKQVYEQKNFYEDIKKVIKYQ